MILPIGASIQPKSTVEHKAQPVFNDVDTYCTVYHKLSWFGPREQSLFCTIFSILYSHFNVDLEQNRCRACSATGTLACTVYSVREMSVYHSYFLTLQCSHIFACYCTDMYTCTCTCGYQNCISQLLHIFVLIRWRRRQVGSHGFQLPHPSTGLNLIHLNETILFLVG